MQTDHGAHHANHGNYDKTPADAPNEPESLERDLFAELLAEVTAKPAPPPPPAFRSEWQTTANIYQWFTHICPVCSREHSVLQGTMIRQKSLKLLSSYRMIKGMHDKSLPWEHTHVTNTTGQCKDCWEERGLA